MRKLGPVLAILGLLCAAVPAAAAVKILPGHYARCPAGFKNINSCPDVLLDATARQTQLYFQPLKSYCTGIPRQHAGVWPFTPQIKTRKGKFKTTYNYENMIGGHEHDANGLGIRFTVKGTFKKGGKLSVTIDGKVTHAEAPIADCNGVTIHETHVLRHTNR